VALASRDAFEDGDDFIGEPKNKKSF